MLFGTLAKEIIALVFAIVLTLKAQWMRVYIFFHRLQQQINACVVAVLNFFTL